MRYKAAICIILALAVIGPVAAQPAQRSAEEAQRFLQIQFDRGTILLVGIRRNPDRQILSSVPTMLELGRPPCTTGYRLRSDINFIRWERIISVRQRGSRVVILQQSGSQQLFDFGSPELSRRAVNAMEILRQACDPAADTGL